MSKHAELLIIAGVICVFLLLILYAGAYIVTDMQCLKHGYRDAKITISLEQFCIKRVDQTDIVTPLQLIRSDWNE